eukprot:GEMP01020272.1.p1 GENE.GEMP01020272.1~~GEMP01020272.1.p1  ORF type:complete len:523 (+),score=104.16 GEMP01020272.1:82-1650(+)
MADGEYMESYSVIKRRNAEYETEVHFQKCYGVLEEIFALHDSFTQFLPMGFRFLDLGCAPGGFSAFLLDDSRCRGGCGVTLTNRSGGFPMRLRSDVFFLQLADLFEVDVNDLVATRVHFLLCDAQYLRNNVAWDDKYTGVRLRSKQHGVWALLVKQLWLGLMRLNEGGVLVFRFGWKDVDDEPTVWYKKISIRLFTIMHDLFQEVRDVKSDFFNAKHSSFYVACFGFKEQRHKDRHINDLFCNTFEELIYSGTDDYTEHDILSNVDAFRTEEVDKTISDMLDRVNKLRLIHLESSRWHERREQNTTDRRTVCVRPLPEYMSLHQLQEISALYGRVITCDIEEEPDRTGVIVFPNLKQAHAAVNTLLSKNTFGETVSVWVKNDDSDGWDAEWMVGKPGKGNHAVQTNNAAPTGSDDKFRKEWAPQAADEPIENDVRAKHETTTPGLYYDGHSDAHSPYNDPSYYGASYANWQYCDPSYYWNGNSGYAPSPAYATPATAASSAHPDELFSATAELYQQPLVEHS